MIENSLGFKLINHIDSFVSSKQGTIPVFCSNDDKRFIRATAFDSIPSATPYKMGINGRALQEFINKLSEDKAYGIAGICVMVDGKLVCKYFNSPYSEEYRHVSFSMCKTVTSMAIGLCVMDGLLSLDERLCDIFGEHNGLFTKKGMRNVTVRHLLTMTAGISFDEINSYFSSDWCKSYMDSEPVFKPGNEFYYNSLNSYMLSAIIKKKTGKNMLKLLDERIFMPLGITDITWDKCPCGIEEGGWGMKLSLPDMLKLGELFRNHGSANVDGKLTTLLDPLWIKESTTCHVDINDPLCVKGYGYHIWILKDGSYLFNGVFGQNIYVNEDRKLVIAITASAYEIFPEGRLVEQLLRFAEDNNNFVPVRIRSSWKRTKPGKRIVDKFKKELLNYLAPYIDVEYHFSEYASSILPLSVQVIYSNYLTGIETVTIMYVDGGLGIRVRDNGESFIIKLGYMKDKPFEYQVINIHGKEIPLAASAVLTSDEEGEKLLRIQFNFLEEIGNRIIKLYFEESGVRLEAYETPDLFTIARQLKGEKKIYRLKKLSGVEIPDYMKYKINKLLAPVAFGVKE